MRSGYLYVLVHPSDPMLYKIGVTILQPEERLAQHNSQHERFAGKIVKETGQKWELKTFIAVPDPYWAESAFWSATSWADVPYRGGVEVARMDWQSVQAGLDAARNAGVSSPKPAPQWVDSNTAWMKKRLEGRGITLVGHVRSKYGKSNFQCGNGHQWRAVPNDVAQGEGCPQCGIGKIDPEDSRNATRSAFLCLLVHPNKPGLIQIRLIYKKIEHCREENIWDGWEIHRYRSVEEPTLAESLIWELLGCPSPDDRQPVSVDLHRAEQAFRELIPRIRQELDLVANVKKSAHQSE